MNAEILLEYLEFTDVSKYTVSAFNKLYFSLFNEKKSAKACLIKLLESNKDLSRRKNTIYGARLLTIFEHGLKLRVKELEGIVAEFKERDLMESENFDINENYSKREIVYGFDNIDEIGDSDEYEEVGELVDAVEKEHTDNSVKETKEVKELTYEEKAFNDFTRIEPNYSDLSFSKIYEMYKEYGNHVFNDDDHCKYSHKMFYYAEKYSDAVFDKYSNSDMSETNVRRIISKYIVKHYVPIARVEWVNSIVHSKFDDKWFEDDIFEHLVSERIVDFKDMVKKLRKNDMDGEAKKAEKRMKKLEERKQKMIQIERDIEESQKSANKIYQKYLLDGKIMQCIDEEGYEFLYNGKKYIRYGRYYLECDDKGSDKEEVNNLSEMGFMRTMDVENDDNWRFNFDYTMALSKDFQTKRVIDVLDYKSADSLMEIAGCAFRKCWLY